MTATPHGRRLRLLPYALLIPLLCLQTTVFGQDYFGDIRETPADRPVITVTATRLPSTEETQTTKVITSRRLRDLGIHTLKEALNLLSDVYILNAGGVTGIHLNGMQAYHYVLLLDGIEIRDPNSPQGAPYLDAIALDAIDRIEVVAGSAGTLYGSNTAGGVIQIFTKKSDRTARIWKARYTSRYTDGIAFVSEPFGEGNLDMSFNFYENHRLSSLRNTPERDKDSRTNYQVRLTHPLGNGDMRLQYRKNQSEQEFDDDFTMSDDPNAVTIAYQDLIAAEFRHPFFPDSLTTFRYTNTITDRQSRNPTDNVNPSMFPFDDHFVGTLENIELLHQTNIGPRITVLSGLRHQIDHILTNPYGPDIRHHFSTGGFMHVDSPTDIVHLRGGFRFERYQPGHIIGTYALTVSRELPGLPAGILGSLRSGYRHPSLFELHSFFGDPSLTAERSHTAEGKVWLTLNNVTTAVSFFKTTVNDAIIFNSAASKYENIPGHMATTGTEFALNLPRISFMRYLNASYTLFASAQGNGNRSLRIPSYKFTVNSAASAGPLIIGATLLSLGDRIDFGGHYLAGYTILSTNIRYPLSRGLEAFLTVENLFNTDYQDVFGYAVEGRTIYVGCRQEI